MKTRKIVSLILALALVVSLLAACNSGSTGTASNTASSGNSGTGTESKAATVEDVYGEGMTQDAIEAMQNSGTILMYTTDNNIANGKMEKDGFEARYTEWAKQYYGLTIKYRYRAWSGTQFEKFLTDFAADDAPDFLSVNYYMWPKVGLRNLLYTTEELEKKGVVGLDHPIMGVGSDAYERYSIGGKHYAVSVSPSLVAIGVNLDLFEQYKVKSPVDYYKEGTWDMDAYVKCAKELTRTLADGTKIWGAFSWNYNWFMMANDAALISWDNTNTKLIVTMNDPKVQRACGAIAELFTNKYTPMGSADTFFKQGQLGFYGAIAQNLASMLRGVTFKWDVVPFPYGADNASGAYPSELYASSVVSSTKNPQGVINYMISRKIFKQSAQSSDWMPDNDYYNSFGYNTFTAEQVKVYEAYTDKASMDLSLGVGNLAVDFGFWNNLRDGSKSYKECVDTYETVYEEQCRLENEEAEKARKAAGN